MHLNSVSAVKSFVGCRLVSEPRQNFSSASRAALYEKLRTVKAQLRHERQEKLEMKDSSWMKVALGPQ